MSKRNLACLAAFAALIMATAPALAESPKYVFFFIGDGMSSAQIQAAEAYLTTENGGSATEAGDLAKRENRLNMSTFPVLGMQTTYDAHALMTDSASAGTALSCGIKTLSGVIGMDDTKTTSYKSIAQLADEQGKRVGIISSVSLDHATPASFYASVANRGYMNTIATQLVAAGYDFYGGGGLVAPTGAARIGDTTNDIWNLLEKNGYSVFNERESILALRKEPKSRVVCINPVLQDSKAMPYAIDRDANSLSLAEMTSVALDSLLTRKKERTADAWPSRDQGFFLMVEGGKIDWACHANDAMAAIGDILDFDDAIGVALEFYRKHPGETLIVVTGDHETGGMTIGHATTGYTGYYHRLLGQKSSFTSFSQNEWPAFKAGHGSSLCAGERTLENNTEMRTLMQTVFGLEYTELNALQKEKLEDAFNMSLCGSNSNSSSENTLLYGGYEPIIVTITHILNERASIGWTSYSHTGVPVPVFAIGQESQRFAGFYDNTDIAKQMAKSMGVWQPLPIKKSK